VKSGGCAPGSGRLVVLWLALGRSHPTFRLRLERRQHGGHAPRRAAEAIEGAEDLDGESYSYRFSNMGWVTAFFLRRDQFVSAALDDQRLVIEPAGTTLDIYAPPKSQR
jgi:hypothetical protein